ncbi:MAG TPA: NAD(P)H-binding protein, partial [Polyangiaceae bacterium]|nr:NAD(P)H-binding protein [Polyangiaceae bacterium]
MTRRVLLTGATGFMGRRVFSALVDAGWDVVCASRDADERSYREPTRTWVRFDVHEPSTVDDALQNIDAVLYLIHSMGQTGDFEIKERAAAETLLGAAETAKVKRIVYLGGVAPTGEASKHLRSRILTGEILRGGGVPTIELRAGMIIGAGGQSWQMVRDLSARLPFMILPSWLQNHSQPVAVADVVFALVRSLELAPAVRGVFDLPGPETLTGEELLKRVAALLGRRPYTLRVPLLTPRLSSYWLKVITRADFGIAQELVAGLTSDLVAQNQLFWSLTPERVPTALDVAALSALREEQGQLGLGTRVLE